MTCGSFGSGKYGIAGVGDRFLDFPCNMTSERPLKEYQCGQVSLSIVTYQLKFGTTEFDLHCKMGLGLVMGNNISMSMAAVLCPLLVHCSPSFFLAQFVMLP